MAGEKKKPPPCQVFVVVLVVHGATALRSMPPRRRPLLDASDGIVRADAECRARMTHLLDAP